MKPNQRELEAIAEHRNRKERVVFTNGCFDLLHIGHTRYLTAARALGDVLVVGLNTDASIRRLKGSSRPIIPEAERKEMLLNLRSVDYVCLFDDDTPLTLIQEVRPNLLVKGGDWKKETIVGWDFVESYGGEVRSLLFIEDHSTTSIIERIRRAQ